eukprot:TRINITY_DN32928_c2_g1_i1.p1 TRINITY_DN32928_c2_g1~~TRINITY_DN32928_c2_g1_i1.p1  ORF type:complete len:104 (+),score=11.67 TRINITY_DN32928_c2_g1_i1:220-531(+)
MKFQNQRTHLICDLDVCKNKVIYLYDQCLENNSVNTRNHAKMNFQRFEQAWISKSWKPKLILEGYTYLIQAFWFSIALLAFSAHSPSLDFKIVPKVFAKSLSD